MKKYTNLTWTNLSAQTNKKNLLKNISGTAYASKIHAIMGNTSSGKSTLLNMLSGIVPPNLHTYGEIKLDSSNVPSDFVFFAPLLPTDYIDLRTKVNNFLTYSQLSYLKLIGLESKSTVKLSELSECEFKLVKLISNFDNQILFLDDPFSQLDIQHSINLIKLIKKITKEKELITIITRNENFEKINQFIDSVTYLNDGNLVFAGEIADLITDSQIQTKEDPLNTLIIYHQKNYEPKKEEVNFTNQIKSSKKYSNYSLNISNIFYLIKNYSINGIKSLNLLTLIFYLSAILIYLSSSIYINDLKDHILEFMKKKTIFLFLFIYLLLQWHLLF
ncbi:ABC transporter ATP-binding [Tubulinosema ratisbonensis]|uniref:ABC transporter ATP-binding n=1 Tax=Tubulinosema ratisbonensis TaxID=291195 RepID=A0A437AL63_9MICR|nr:ABC transporter ATP-binding [Tubulinosema ratisbonensis]